MIRKIKSDILASIKNKRINVFILFLLSAFVILIFTKLSKDYTNTIIFNIDKVNVPQENVILNDSNTVLVITLKTHGFKWLDYYFSKPKIKVDFSKDVYKRDSVFIWSKSKAFLKNTQFDKNVELLNISPDTLVFLYDVNLIKRVPVKLNATIGFAPGYDVSETYVLEPDSVQIIGPNVLVSNINNIETDSVYLSEVRSNLSQTIKLKLPENNKELTFSTKNVILKASVEKFTEGTLKIPVNVINVPPDRSLKFFPKEVNVSYSVSLSNFNSINSTDFKVVCDYNKISSNQSVLIPELVKIPKLVKNAKINQKHIEFIITE
ncbi:CdaR family protein [Thalassobellus suaedae]|uniref:YbbR-like domain-containing protein n=1 Tax=Thalassobellus suaedae TaxID=3074124 RepID=A0ABY9XVM2_9FLAO|nr:YbbR-like domain-containing protein [Flavobacteriaceae bacterium HL-DH14]